MFDPSEDYVEEMSTRINTLFDNIVTKSGLFVSHSSRCSAVQDMTDTYVANTGERPKSGHLDRLATYILKENRLGGAWDALKDVEYPFLSDRQYQSRLSKEASLVHAGTYDTMHRNCAVKTRTARIQLELKTKKVK